MSLTEADVAALDDHVRSAGLPSRSAAVRVEHAGAGRPLLLVNGIGATGDLFDTFRAHLVDRETISFDAPGVGGSSTPHYPPTLRRLAAVVAELVGSVGHERVDVLGLSWGGALVQEHHPPAPGRRPAGGAGRHDPGLGLAARPPGGDQHPGLAHAVLLAGLPDPGGADPLRRRDPAPPAPSSRWRTPG